MNKKKNIIFCTLMKIAILPTASSINKIKINQLTNKLKIGNRCGCPNNKKSFFPEYAVMEKPPDISIIDDTSLKPIHKNTPNQFSWKNNDGKD